MSSDPASCTSPKPLVALEGETARAAILNYNLPSSTTFRVKNYIKVYVPDDYWNAEARRGEIGPHALLAKPPQISRLPVVEARPTKKVETYLKDALRDPLLTYKPPQIGPDPIDQGDPFAGFLNPLLVELAVKQPALQPLLWLNQPQSYAPQFGGTPTPGTNLATSVSNTQVRSLPLSANSALRQVEGYLGTSLSEINLNAAYGALPAFRRTLFGSLTPDYIKNPGSTARPTLVLIEEYEVASYLGDYGAGKTLKTFSLLPGEKTTISIKTFRNTTENQSQTENILDSFSQKSADTLEAMVNDELATSEASSDATSLGFSSAENWQQQGSLSVSAGLNIGILKSNTSIKGSLSHSDTDVNTSTSNSTRANTVSGLKKSMDRHVAQSEAARKVDVNTETQQSVSTASGDEQSTVRDIQNINHSRVLNFVFRQLYQEYVTVTSLNDVSFGFTKGQLSDGRTERLDNLEGLLRSVLKDEYIDEVLTTLIDELANVAGFQGRAAFVERHEEEVVSLVHPERPPTTRRYYRKSAELAQSWDDSGKTVKGIILDVTRRILTTDALIVEALLGQGEGLDCYNQRLQNAAADRADLDNDEKKQALEIISGIESPSEKANLYKKVYGTDPQTVVQSTE